MNRAELQQRVFDLVAVCQGVVDHVGDYTSIAHYEADAAEIRAQVGPLCAELEQEWGVDAFPVVRLLRATAAKLLVLRSAISETTQTLEIIVRRDTSAVELAAERYQDWTRWTEICELNPDMQHPGRIRAGSAVVVMRA